MLILLSLHSCASAASRKRRKSPKVAVENPPLPALFITMLPPSSVRADLGSVRLRRDDEFALQ